MTNIAFTAPHHLAAQAGLDLLKNGANAVDAMIAAAATISVAYPHMNSIGGDGFWLIQKPGGTPIAIDACGFAGEGATLDYFSSKKYSQIPCRGLDASVCIAGTVGGWQLARKLVTQKKLSIPNSTTTKLSLASILKPAIELAQNGVRVSESLSAASQKVLNELYESNPSASVKSNAIFDEFKKTFSRNGKALMTGEMLKNPDLAATLQNLAKNGLEDFYRGDLADTLGNFFESFNGPLKHADFSRYSANEVTPLQFDIRKGSLFNLPPPTQGLASLLIMAIYDDLYREDMSELDSTHLIVEATKQAFLIRDQYISDPSGMSISTDDLLSKEHIAKLTKNISKNALDWPRKSEPGDTVWMGCVDQDGLMVSFIQSIYWEFGSAVVIPGTGIVWNNRGLSFSLDQIHHNSVSPHKKPLHTLNPALSVLNDGSRMVYGTMGGEGQPQTQAAIFTRKFYQNLPLKDSINKGRWLIGRTWGEQSTDLRLEKDLYKDIGSGLENRGHKIKVVPSASEMMGHAGAIIVSADNTIECASDARSDGAGLTATSIIKNGLPT